MISQTQTASNQYGFYAVPKKLQPKKKYRDEEYQNMMDANDDQQQSNQFHPISRPTHPQNQIEPDYYINQAPYPQFKPKQSGLDYGIQVVSQELMDFDLQVTPLLQIIVGRCVVSAINQLQQEKQKHQKKQQAQKYRKKRNAQLMVTQRLQAKSKRKHQQTQRRQLQQTIYHKNNRHVHEKVIVRKLTKNKLLNLAEDVISELQQDGMLRYEPTLQLRIDYEGWLYDQVTKMIQQQQQITSCVKKIINQAKQDDEDKHKKKIQKQKQRRRQIINQRQRIKKINEERREKKRIHKYRLNLHNLRQPIVRKFEQLLQTSSNDVESVLKCETYDDGFVESSGQQALHISGGLFPYLMVLLNSTPQVHHTPDQLQQILIKIINQAQSSIQIPVQKGQKEKIKQLVEEMQKQPNKFMIDKVSKVADIAKHISLNTRLIDLVGIEIKPLLHQAMILTLMNIYFTTIKIPSLQQETKKEQNRLPQQEQQQSQQSQQHKLQQQQPMAIYSPTQQDKLRSTIREKLLFKQITNEQQRYQKLQNILRVRFQRQVKQSDHQSSSTPRNKQNEKKKNQQEWIDIYDGQGWQKKIEKNPIQVQRETQKPSTYQLTGFGNIFVYDQRVLHYLRKQVERVLEIESGEEVDKYSSGLANIATKLGKKDIPVIDAELTNSQ